MFGRTENDILKEKEKAMMNENQKIITLGQNIVRAFEKVENYRSSIEIHTYLILIVVPLLIAATILHMHTLIGVETYWWVHHTPEWEDGLEHLTHAANMLEMDHDFGAFAYDSSMKYGRELEALVDSHWQRNVMWWLILFHVLMVLPFAIRWLYLRFVRTYETTILVIYFMAISSIVQLGCVFVRIGLCIIDEEETTVWELLCIVLNLLLFFLEAATAFEVFEIKRFVNYFSYHWNQYHTFFQVFSELEEEKEQQTNINNDEPPISSSSSSSTFFDFTKGRNVLFNNEVGKRSNGGISQNNILSFFLNNFDAWNVRKEVQNFFDKKKL